MDEKRRELIEIIRDHITDHPVPPPSKEKYLDAVRQTFPVDEMVAAGIITLGDIDFLADMWHNMASYDFAISDEEGGSLETLVGASAAVGAERNETSLKMQERYSSLLGKMADYHNSKIAKAKSQTG